MKHTATSYKPNSLQPPSMHQMFQRFSTQPISMPVKKRKFYNNQPLVLLQGTDASKIKSQKSSNPPSNRRLNSDYEHEQFTEEAGPPGDESQKYLNEMLMAQEYISKDRISEGLSILTNLFKSQRDLAGVKKVALLYNIGCCQHRLGQTDECLRSIEGAVKTLLNHYIQGQNDIRLQKVQLKMTLQLCAIMSQANEHEQALRYATQAEQTSMKIVQTLGQMCEQLMFSISREKQKAKSRQLEDIENDNEEDDGDYTPATGALLRKIRSGATLPIMNNPLNVRRTSANIENSVERQKIEESIQNGTSKTIESSFVSTTQLKYDHRLSASRKRMKNKEDLSLERIHTFHLKRSPVRVDEVPEEQPIKVLPISGQKAKDILMKRNSVQQTQSVLLLSPSDKAYYFQEKTLIQQDAFIRSIQPVILELQKLLQIQDGVHFQLKHCFADDKDIESLKSNNNFKPVCIRSILGLPKASLSSLTGKANAIGKREDSWIYHLNIGNVMHLAPLSGVELEALIGIEKQEQKSGMQEDETNPHLGSAETMISPDRGGAYSKTSQSLASSASRLNTQTKTVKPKDKDSEAILQIKSELSKNELLDKIVLIIVSLFCMGTELRFKSQLYAPPTQNSPLSQQISHTSLLMSPQGNLSGRDATDEKDRQQLYKEIRAKSERWHANAIHLASTFLPDECPLVGHMINSYKKHHMRARQSMAKRQNRSSSRKQEENQAQTSETAAITTAATAKQSGSLFEDARKNLKASSKEADFLQSPSDLALKKHQLEANFIMGKSLAKLQMFSERRSSNGVGTADEVQSKEEMLEQTIKKTQITRNQILMAPSQSQSSMKLNDKVTNTAPKAVVTPSQQNKRSPKTLQTSKLTMPHCNQRSPREIVAKHLQYGLLAKQYSKFQLELLGKAKKKERKEALDSSRMSDLGGEGKADSVGMNVVNREFGALKRPLNNLGQPSQQRVDTMHSSDQVKISQITLDDTLSQPSGIAPYAGDTVQQAIQQCLVKYRSQESLLSQVHLIQQQTTKKVHKK